MKFYVPIQVDTRVVISEIDSNDNKTVLHDDHNAIHNQNMSRAIARGLAREPNYFLHRIAFGNGGTFTDAVGNLIFNPPNDGRDGSGGWAATLYNETYSEIIDDENVSFGTDPGSAGRYTGGAAPLDDTTGGGVISYEAGEKSVVKITMYLNENEPAGQLADEGGPELEEDEQCFYFDELGLFTSGLPGVATSGSASVEVGDKTSEDITLLAPLTSYDITVTVDGVEYTAIYLTPAGGSGSGGEFTYGDLCEGINEATWHQSGTDLATVLHASITDRSGGTYPSIVAEQTFGYLTFSSLTTGTSSTMELTCDSGDANEIFNVLTGGICDNVNVNTQVGQPAGVQNNAIDPTNERERMLTHLIFSPILKHSNRSILIEYYLTISVPNTSDSTVSEISA